MRILEIADKELDFEAWICLDTERNGMAFGGCRFDLSVTREVVTNLAQCMTWKLAAHGLPVGGAKGGVRVDPRNPRLKEILAKFAQGARPLLSTSVLIGKDLGATNDMMDAVYAALGVPQLHIVRNRHAGVPERLRDFTGYQPHMTGLGVAIATRTALNGKTQGLRAVIQGFGAVGLGSAYRLGQMGVLVTAISDAKTAVYKPSGFTFVELEKLGAGGEINVDAFPWGAKAIPRDELLSLEADILVLAATSNCVNEKMAASIKCPVISEGANFPLLAEARALLQKRGVLVVPDIIANSSSGAMVAHQMASGNSLSHDKLWNLIEGGIVTAVRNTMEVAHAENLSLRDAYINIVVPRLAQKAA